MTQIAKLESYGLLQAEGADARAFLHAQLTSDIEGLAAGRARRAGWCSAKGRLLATLLVVPAEGGFLLQLARDLAPAVLKRLQMFVLRSKVRLSDATPQWDQYGLWGADVAAALQPLGVSLPQEDLSVAAGSGALAVRVGAGRCLLLAPPSLRGSLAAAAREDDWRLAQIRDGQPEISAPTQDQFVPQMVNLELTGGVDFHKGCYPGQEVVARTQYRGAVKRRLYRLRGAQLAPGQSLHVDDAPEGGATVLNAAADELLAVLPVASVEAGAPVRARQGAAPLELLPLPYAR
ncbi:MAG TPA: folate-binding protein [Burkholderiales bacterium]|nr:folate-binding protein [Burkholderiales bacterium]